MNRALVWMFQIHDSTAEKLVWAGLTLANVGMMLALAIRSGRPGFRVYMGLMAACALVQGTTLWASRGEAHVVGILGEAALILFGALWSYENNGNGTMFSACIGVAVMCGVWFAIPLQYPGYPKSLYMERLYSSAFFCGVALGRVVLPWFGGEGIRWRVALAAPWFGAVLFASMMVGKFGLGRWTIAIIANATWTACLAGWLIQSLPPIRTKWKLKILRPYQD